MESIELKLDGVVAPYITGAERLENEIATLESQVEAAEAELQTVLESLKRSRNESKHSADEPRPDKSQIEKMIKDQLRLRDNVYWLNEVWRVAILHRDRLRIAIKQSKKCIKEIAQDCKKYEVEAAERIRKEIEASNLHISNGEQKIASLKMEADYRTVSLRLEKISSMQLEKEIQSQKPQFDDPAATKDSHDECCEENPLEKPGVSAISKISCSYQNDLHDKIMDLIQEKYSTLGRELPKVKNLAVVVGEYWIEKRGRFQVKSWPA